MINRAQLFVSLALIALTFSADLHAATIRVEKWGENSASCGSKSAPCESIQFAIDNRAGPKDKVLVGRGLFRETILIDTNLAGESLAGLRLESTHGLHATMIRPTLAGENGIFINAPAVRIGRKNKGFSVRSSAAAIISGPLIDNIRVEGNRVYESNDGIWIHGEKPRIRNNIAEHINNTGIFCNACVSGLIKDNISRNNNYGIVVDGYQNLVVARNVASHNAVNGFLTGVGGSVRFDDNVSEFNGGSGFELDMSNTDAKRNIAFINDGHGFSLIAGLPGGSPSINDNASISNGVAGILVDDVQDIDIRGNSVNGNLIGISMSVGSTVGTLDKNNTYASLTGCGLGNFSGAEIPYKFHYFGAPTGPDDGLDADNHDGVCGIDALTGTFKATPNTFKANAAAGL